MADPAAEARIRDLQRRLELDPSSRLFVALAEELRKVSRYSEALSALQKGLLAHPNYVSAQVALGRVYLESGQVTEAIATFSKALTSDPGNLVSAKSLADIYLSRGDGVEAIKKYKLYRALSGDRRVDDIVSKLERELAPPPPPPRPTQTDVIPPPPSFGEAQAPKRITKVEPRPMWTESEPAPAPPPKPKPAETLDIAAVVFEPTDDSYPPAAEMPQVLSRDTPLWPTVKPVAPTPPPPVPAAPPPRPAPPPGAEADVKTRALRISEILGEATLTARPPRPTAKPAPSAPQPPAPVVPPPAPIPWPATNAPATAVSPPAAPIAPPAEPFSQAPAAASADAGPPRGRTLADLYFAQGHYAEALGIYDDLVLANPGDEELKRLRRDAEARLLPAWRTPEAAVPDPGLGHRLARIRVLKQWLSVVQAR